MSQKKKAVVLVNNEIILSSLEKILEGMGCETHRDIDSCREADFGFVGSYFALLGILNHIHAVRSSLPLVLVVSKEHDLDGDLELDRDFYDIVRLDSYDEADVRQKITQWFSEEHGALLVQGG